jgi:hypothetical protein
MANIFNYLSVCADGKFYQWYLKSHSLYVNELLDREKLREQKSRFSSCNDVVNSDSHKPESDGSTYKQLWIVQGNLRMWSEDTRELYFYCVIDTGANTNTNECEKLMGLT